MTITKILQRESWCWSLLGLKGLKNPLWCLKRKWGVDSGGVVNVLGAGWFSYSNNYYFGWWMSNQRFVRYKRITSQWLISTPSHPTPKTLTISHGSTHWPLLFLNLAAVVDISFLICNFILATCIFWNFRALDLPVWYKYKKNALSLGVWHQSLKWHVKNYPFFILFLLQNF